MGIATRGVLPTGLLPDGTMRALCDHTDERTRCIVTPDAGLVRRAKRLLEEEWEDDVISQVIKDLLVALGEQVP